MKKPEILAPTGTKESVIAALNGGCDAIYIGGKSFNARQYASNPSDNELKDIINICHLRGVKVFITLNILYKENEISDVLDFVKTVYDFGADGLIIQDIGMFSLVKDFFPDIIKSASTQMSVHNTEGVRLLSELGYGRIVLARELSLKEVCEINKIKGNTEIEAFAHGALCVCYSGRCLMSSIIGQRSGNRGRCAQPCRMDYTFIKDNKVIKKGCLISPKDISTVEIMDKIAESGVDSLKIEGRMKSPEYVYEVVSQYRKYIDEVYESSLNVEDNDIRELTQIFNRGGSSSNGYYNCYSGQTMISSSSKSSGIEIGKVIDYNFKKKQCRIKLNENVTAGDGIEIWSKNHVGTGINKNAGSGETITVNIDGKINKGDRVFKSYDKALNDKLKKTYQKITRKLSVNVKAKVDRDESYIEFSDYGLKVYGQCADKAQNQPMMAEAIISRLSKTGDTPFEFKFTEYNVGENIYIPVSALNALRRDACERLEEHIVKSYERKSQRAVYNTDSFNKAERPVVTARVRTMDQLKACAEAGVKKIYCDTCMDTDRAYEICRDKGIEMYISLPYVSRQGYQSIIDRHKNCDGYLMRSYSKIYTDKPVAVDYSLNIFNRAAVNEIRNIFKGNAVTLSPELNIKELSQIADESCEIVVYGRLPLMTTHQCPIGLYDGEKGRGKYCKLRNKDADYRLIDRTKTEFPIIRDCNECIAFILNSAPIYVLNRAQEIIKIGAGYIAMEFTVESYEETFAIAMEHINVIEKGNRPSDIKEFTGETTGGHFNRGVL